jgi:hypothetical protein
MKEFSDNVPAEILGRHGIFEVSRRQYKLSVEPSWHYFAFFRLLQLSPSYWLAHQAEIEGSPPQTWAPAEFAAVRKNYSVFGPVWEIPFWEWWFERAQFAFGIEHTPTVQVLGQTAEAIRPDASMLGALSTAVADYFGQDILLDALPATLLLAIPLNAGKTEVLKQIESLLERSTPVNYMQAAARFRMLKTKTRRTTMNAAIRTVQARAHFGDKPLYFVGNRSKVSPALETPEDQTSGDHAEKRREMAFVTSRHIRRAWIWSENAARGRFPDPKAPADDGEWPRFDFGEIKVRLAKYEKISSEAYEQIPEAKRTSEKRYQGRNRTIRY